jgi:hypothetical protein
MDQLPTPRGRSRRPFTDERKAEYLEALARDGDHAFARLEVGVCTSTVDNHRRKDPDFDAGCEDALHRYRKRFIDELVRRGVDGVERPVFHEGVIVGHVTEYSDRLLLEHLKVVDKRYRNQVDLNVEAHVQTTDLQLDKLQPESRELLERILEIEAAAAARPVEVEGAADES